MLLPRVRLAMIISNLVSNLETLRLRALLMRNPPENLWQRNA